MPSMPAPPGERHGRLHSRLWRSRDAATAIEMAFLLPVFLMFLLGIEEFGRALWTQTALQFAVERAARCAAISPSACEDVPAYAASQVFGLSIPAESFTYTQNANSPGTALCQGTSSAGTGGAVVNANYVFPTIVPQLVPINVTLTACSYHP
jgi:Flp pilus assembly protein TadG